MESNLTPYEHYKKEAINHVEHVTNSKKLVFDFKDTIRLKARANKRVKTIIEAIIYLDKNPLRDNDYFKYLNSYITHGIKLNEKYFRHNLNKLNDYYKRADKEKINPFNKSNYESYVIYMFLKLHGDYETNDDLIFHVKNQDFREYNPLTKIPSVLRGSLPFEVKEYDIKRAFPSFIDIELGTDFRHDIYDKIEKSKFAMYLNSNKETTITIDNARKGLKPIYNGLTNEVITDKRYNEKGRAFKDFAQYESEYIQRFIIENKILNFARLHDGVFVLENVHCEKLIFDKVEFTIKECIKPKIENNTISFYYTDDDGTIKTSPSKYADFLIQENFIRISTQDDKIQLLKNTNNVIDFFNHKTDMVSYLECEINETISDSVRNVIARDNTNVLMQSFTLLEPVELIYYKDTKQRFGIPFSNGFYYFEDPNKFDIQQKQYSEVNGFFTPHPTQKRKFQYTDEVGNFETFIQRISTGNKDFDTNDSNQLETVRAFNSMIGYLCHNYKSMTESPCIVLTDEGANEVNRNGRRGKSLIGKALKEVVKMLTKGGNEFVGSYIHNFADLNKSFNLYLIDDIPAGFNFNDLYTNISLGINVQHKGSKAEMIEFEDSPKFLITSNYLMRYNSEDSSTIARFIEYKVKPYYNKDFSPQNEFSQTFFEDWDEMEWNKFYSYVFRCVHFYLSHGLKSIQYDKTEDNYKAYFNDVKESEMARIIDELINVKNQISFNVSQFVSVYNHFDNPLRNERFFDSRNSKNLIDTYLNFNKGLNLTYKKREKRWFKD